MEKIIAVHSMGYVKNSEDIICLLSKVDWFNILSVSIYNVIFSDIFDMYYFVI